MSKYWICEYGFEKEDPKHKGYSFKEVDIYGHIPGKAKEKYGVKNHRLTVWKNLQTNEFELIAVPMEEKVFGFNAGPIFDGVIMISNQETGEKHEVIIKHKDLEVICQEATELHRKYWGHDITYLVCTHDSWEMSCDKKYI